MARPTSADATDFVTEKQRCGRPEDVATGIVFPRQWPVVKDHDGGRVSLDQEAQNWLLANA
jgi:hypothetical protein